MNLGDLATAILFFFAAVTGLGAGDTNWGPLAREASPVLHRLRVDKHGSGLFPRGGAECEAKQRWCLPTGSHAWRFTRQPPHRSSGAGVAVAALTNGERLSAGLRMVFGNKRHGSFVVIQRNSKSEVESRCGGDGNKRT